MTREHKLRQAAAATGGWITIQECYERESHLNAAISVHVRSCPDYPKLGRRSFRVKLQWRQEPEGSRVIAYDEWRDVCRAWEEGRKKNAKAPEPHLYNDGSLCLGLEVEVQRDTTGEVDIEKYLKQKLIPHLCQAAETAQGQWQEGNDRPHDIAQGYWDWWGEQLGLNPNTVKEMTARLVQADDAEPCPCGSKLIYGVCHGPILRTVQERFGKSRTPVDWQQEAMPDSWLKGKTPNAEVRQDNAISGKQGAVAEADIGRRKTLVKDGDRLHGAGTPSMEQAERPLPDEPGQKEHEA